MYMAHPYYLPKIGIPVGTSFKKIPNNEVTQIINSERYMSVEHMIKCLSPYTIEFLHESRLGIKKRHLIRYDEAVDRIFKERSL